MRIGKSKYSKQQWGNWNNHQKPPAQEMSNQMASLMNSTKHLKEDFIHILLKLFWKLTKRQFLLTHFMRPTFTLIAKPGKDNPNPPQKLGSNTFVEYKCKNPSKWNIIYQTNNSLQSSGVHSRGTRMGQHRQINQCNTLY